MFKSIEEIKEEIKMDLDNLGQIITKICNEVHPISIRKLFPSLQEAFNKLKGILDNNLFVE